MKLKTVLGWSSALWLAAMPLQAQEANETEKLNKELKQMQERFERMLREQQAQIDALKKQLDAAKTNPPPAIIQPPMALTNGEANLPPGMAAAPWSPAAPIRLAGGGQNYISLSFDALVAAGASTAKDIDKLDLGGHDPKQRGFTVQNLETVFEGKVDPYFRGQANVVLQINPHGDTTIEAEEAYLETMSLPWNLQMKAGQFFTEFGRLNPTHPHTWDFVDQPLVSGRFLGEDGLRSAGARLSWLMPTPFYAELYLTVANSQGGTAFSFRNAHEGGTFMGRPATEGRVKSIGDMLFVPRYAASFNLSDSQTIVAGASAAFGPNSSGEDSATQIYGVDLFYKWKSPSQHAGFPFVTWQTEAMLRRFEASAFPGDLVTPALPRETITDFGLYSQLTYGFRKGWVTALRGDYVFPDKKALYETIVGPDSDRANRWRI